MGKKYDGVRAASTSSIEIDFYYGGSRFKERIKLPPTPVNLKRASLHRAAILDAIERGTFVYSETFPHSKKAPKKLSSTVDSLTVERFFQDWLAQKKPTIKASTFKGYEKIVHNNIIHNFGKFALTDLKRPAIKQWVSSMDAGNKTISNVQSVLRSALQDAMMDELIDSNPMTGWTYRKSEIPTDDDKPDPFSVEEQAAILSVLSGAYWNQVQFSFWTGLRPSELAALDWSDIDFIGRKIKITKAKTQESKIIESTKTRSSVRDVTLLQPAYDALLSQKAHTFLKGKEVFTNPNTGERWNGASSIRNVVWVPALRKCGVRYRKPYQTRHTYASMMVSAGENPVWVANQMGHKDWGMIRRIYAQWMPSDYNDAGGKAVAAFGEKQTKKQTVHG